MLVTDKILLLKDICLLCATNKHHSTHNTPVKKDAKKRKLTIMQSIMLFCLYKASSKTLHRLKM